MIGGGGNVSPCRMMMSLNNNPCVILTHSSHRPPVTTWRHCCRLIDRMLANFECSAMWVKQSTFLVDALNVSQEILEYQRGQMPDFRDWQVGIRRTFLPLAPVPRTQHPLVFLCLACTRLFDEMYVRTAAVETICEASSNSMYVQSSENLVDQKKLSCFTSATGNKPCELRESFLLDYTNTRT